MYLPEEIEAPESWQSVRIETAGVDPEEVDELVYEIGLTCLPFVQEEGAIVVHRDGDELAVSSFTSGVVPDLKVRRFSVVTWQKGI